MSAAAEVHKLSQEWGRPDLYDAFLTATSGQFPLILARITVEVAVAKAARAAAWSAFKDMP